MAADVELSGREGPGPGWPRRHREVGCSELAEPGLRLGRPAIRQDRQMPAGGKSHTGVQREAGGPGVQGGQWQEWCWCGRAGGPCP